MSRVGAAVRASSRELFTISTGVLLGKLVVHLMCVAHPAVEVTMEILVHLAIARLLVHAGSRPSAADSLRLATGAALLVESKRPRASHWSFPIFMVPRVPGFRRAA